MKLLIYNSISAQLNLIATATSQKTLSNLEYTRSKKTSPKNKGKCHPASVRGVEYDRPSLNSFCFFTFLRGGV